MFLVSFAIWTSTFTATYVISHLYLQLAVRIYPGNILCYLVAVAGCFMMFELCKTNWRRSNKPNKIVTLLGMNSLLLYLIHSLDYLWRSLYIVGNEFVNMIVRVMLDVVLFVFIILLSYLIKKMIINKTKKEKVHEKNFSRSCNI